MTEEKITCPVWGLPQRDRDMWDFPTLCGHFKCKVCTATPEDLGYPDEEYLRQEERGREPIDWDIPF